MATVTDPENFRSRVGSYANFTATATVTDLDNKVEFQWMQGPFNVHNHPDDVHHDELTHTDITVRRTGDTTYESTLILRNLRRDDAGDYKVVVSESKPDGTAVGSPVESKAGRLSLTRWSRVKQYWLSATVNKDFDNAPAAPIGGKFKIGKKDKDLFPLPYNANEDQLKDALVAAPGIKDDDLIVWGEMPEFFIQYTGKLGEKNQPNDFFKIDTKDLQPDFKATFSEVVRGSSGTTKRDEIQKLKFEPEVASTTSAVAPAITVVLERHRKKTSQPRLVLSGLSPEEFTAIVEVLKSGPAYYDEGARKFCSAPIIPPGPEDN